MNRETEAAQPAEAGFKLHRRFDRMARLTSDAGMERLQGSLVVVMGLGGVGSFAAEALVRSGIGRLRLVDFDEVCVTNTNRQLHAMKGNIGKPKAQLLADRCALINPLAEVEPVKRFYQEETSDELLAGEPAFVVDAIDNITAKCHLIATCRRRGIPLVSSMGAAGRRRCASRTSRRRACAAWQPLCATSCAANMTSRATRSGVSPPCTAKSVFSRHTPWLTTARTVFSASALKGKTA